jgi:molybdopterin-guanine dinucleotide biosynthesis protein A
MDAQSVRPGVAGVILVGGRSRRMGRDKALLPFPDGSALTFVERLSALLAELCKEVLLVARDETSGREYSFVCQRQHVRVVYDRAADHGPLMGLYSGLHAASFSHALVLAVDLPFVRPSLLSWLSGFPLTDEILVPRLQGIPQVLLARYPRSLLPTIEACLRAGRRDPRALLAQTPVRFLEEEQLREIDPDLRSFVNVNTPEDFEQARSSW